MVPNTSTDVVQGAHDPKNTNTTIGATVAAAHSPDTTAAKNSDVILDAAATASAIEVGENSYHLNSILEATAPAANENLDTMVSWMACRSDTVVAAEHSEKLWKARNSDTVIKATAAAIEVAAFDQGASAKPHVEQHLLLSASNQFY